MGIKLSNRIKIAEMVENTSTRHYSLLKSLSSPLSRLGIHYFCYQFVSTKGEWFTLGNQPDWLHYCAETETHKNDPSLLSVAKVKAGVFLPETHQNHEFRESLVTPAVEQFDIAQCLAIVKPVLEGVEYYFFGGSRHNAHLPASYLNNIHLLDKRFPLLVRQKINTVFQQCREASLDLKALENPVYLNSTDPFFSTQQPHPLLEFEDLFSEIPLVEAGVFYRVNAITVCFTPREADCINLILAGYTSSKKIARQLNISYRTVDEYLTSIRLKTGSKDTLDCIKSLCLTLG